MKRVFDEREEHDLRLDDNGALLGAFESGLPVLPIFIWDKNSTSGWKPGKLWNWWLFSSLESLDWHLHNLGNQLFFIEGNPEQELITVAQNVGATRIFWNREYDPFSMEREKRLVEGLKRIDVQVQIFKGNVLLEPWDLENFFIDSFESFQSYMKFWMKSLHAVSKPIVFHSKIPKLLSSIHWRLGLKRVPKIEDLEQNDVYNCINYLQKSQAYDVDIQIISQSSRLSPHIRFGELSIRQIVFRVKELLEKCSFKHTKASIIRTFLKNLCLREYTRHVVYHHSNLTKSSPYGAYSWHADSYQVELWKQGRTGYPLIDATTRALHSYGWIPNSLRCLLVIFSTSYLMLPWEVGAEIFYSMLIDADIASFVMGWRWEIEHLLDSCLTTKGVVGIVTFCKIIDPLGHFVKKWLPELGNLSPRYIHCPWKLSKEMLISNKIVLGKTYPYPIVKPKIARGRARDFTVFLKRLLNVNKLTLISYPKEACHTVQMHYSEQSSEHICVYLSGTVRREVSPKDEKLMPHQLNEHHISCSDDTSKELFTSPECFMYPNVFSPNTIRPYQPCVIHVSDGSSPSFSSIVDSPLFHSPWFNSFDEAVSERSSRYYQYNPCVTDSIFTTPHMKESLYESHQSYFGNISPNHIWDATKPESLQAQTTKKRSLLSIELDISKYEPVSSQFIKEEKMKSSDVLKVMENEQVDENISTRTRNLTNSNRVEENKDQREQLNGKALTLETCGKTTIDENMDKALQKRMFNLDNIARDSSNEYCDLAQFVLSNYILTAWPYRMSSNDFVRLRNITNAYNLWKPQGTSTRKLQQFKHFFKDILGLEVSGEWDRHYHGGIRGPYVYGIKEKNKS
eukprot:jgi/Galph1/804/GphlegSOOS_G5565.1